MTSVLVTIDTELSPAAYQRGASTTENYDSAILGRVADGEWGIKYQIGRLNEHGVKGVFLVEALSADVVGLDFLKRTIDPILSAGHEVQLHVHTEWLSWIAHDPVDGRRGRNIADFGYDDQCRLLTLGIENLLKAGAPRPIAFRAGNYGANNDTLRALASVGIRYDTSYSFPYLGNPCTIMTKAALLDPVWLDGVIEVPVAFFTDYPDHSRHFQLCAVSNSEMRTVLEQSIAQQRKSAVIVSHSFELLNRARSRANPIVVRRFENLCRMLSEMKACAPALGFFDLDQSAVTESSGHVAPLQSGAWQTASRMVEQAVGTFLYR
jgi:hypothetical protein